MLFIALGVVSVRSVRNQVFRDVASPHTAPAERPTASLPTNAKILAVVSLAVWAGAIVAGRLVEYPVLFGLDKWGLR